MRLRSIQLFTLLTLLLISTLLPAMAVAQDSWTSDFRNMMEIRSIKAMEGSPAHMYALSEEEGLIVFRVAPEGLQWLYTSSGMERRGDRLQADVRFAYLYDESRRLTIVEPTSVLGVYSSTTLPGRPLTVQRLGNRLYIAMGDSGLGRLSLESPDAVDSDPEILFENELQGRNIIDLASDHSSRIYVLAGGRNLAIIDRVDSDERIELNRMVELDREIQKLFLTRDELIGANEGGDLFLINSNGQTRSLGSVEEAVDQLRTWNGQLVVRTRNGRLWIGEFGERLEPWKSETDTDIHFTIVNGQLWVSEHDQISPVVQRTESPAASRAHTGQTPEIRPIENIVIPYPRPVILPLELLSNHDVNEIDFSYRADVQNARIRGQSFYWQPTSGQIGRHRFTIAATTPAGLTDTLSFTVDVRPFNSPPRFTPVQPVTISINEPFSLEINAVDPDGINPDLIRYLGMDLPEGADLNEQTGEFRWSPNIRQVGQHRFQVIATDQFGAAASTNIEIRVIETDPDAEADLDL